MSEKPILFSGPMVQAILEGRKTQTRRVMKPQPFQDGPRWEGNRFERIDQIGQAIFSDGTVVRCPCGQPGDTLWVKERWTLWSNATDWHTVSYAAEAESDGATLTTHPVKCERDLKILSSRGKKNSLWMPREFSRITLRVKGVRVERVQEITTQDIYAEGAISNDWLDWREDAQSIGKPPGSYIERERDVFAALWDSINAKRGFSWSSNPWVWVVEFQKVE